MEVIKGGGVGIFDRGLQRMNFTAPLFVGIDGWMDGWDV